MSDDDSYRYQLSGEEAFRQLLLPTEYGEQQLNSLCESGYELYEFDGERDEERIIKVYNIMTLNALDYAADDLQPERSHPIHTPGELLFATFGAIAIKQYDGFQNLVATGYTEKIRPLQELRDYFSEMALTMLYNTDSITPEEREVIIADVASAMFDKEDTEWGHDVVKAVTSIDRFETEDREDRLYMRFPMLAAHPEMLYYDNETGAENPEDLDVIFKDNSVFVPIDKFNEEFKDGYGQKLFDYFLDLRERHLTEKNITYIADNATDIYDRLDTWAETGNEHRLYRNYNPDSQSLTAVRRAVEAVHGDSENGYTGQEIAHAIDRYNPDESWVGHRLSEFDASSSRAVAQRLSNLDVPIEINETTVGDPNKYILNPTSDHEIEFNEIADILELPCLDALDQDLQSRTDAGPVRWELFTFVRMLMWLPPYYDRATQDIDIDRLVKDLKEFFDGRYPWYDSQKTDYQVRYEYKEGERKGRYASPNCGNKNIKNYCIGQEKCDYTIYGALDFPEEMFENLPDNSGPSL